MEPEKPAKCGGRAKQQLPEEFPAGGVGDADLVAIPEPTPEEAKLCAALEGADPDDVEGIDAGKVRSQQARCGKCTDRGSGNHKD